jgi:thioredoxin reductase (NADPH)
LSTIILDKNPAVGALAITSHIANYPGVDRSMSGAELLDQMRKQVIDYGTRYERAQVFMIEVNEDKNSDDPHNKIVYTPEYMVKARALVLATGAMGRSLPPFPGEDTYLGQGVSYCATCDGAFYRDSVVCVFGGTNEAVEEALFLTKFASKVHWITSTDVLACFSRSLMSTECNKMIDEELVQELLSKPNVQHWEKTKLLSVEGDGAGVTGVKVKKVGVYAKEELIEVEGAFIYGAGGGSKPITDFCQGKVDLDESGGVIVDRDSMETSVEGVFAIGDIRNTAYKQVVVAAADGCMAAMSIEKFLKGRKTVKVDWIHK